MYQERRQQYSNHYSINSKPVLRFVKTAAVGGTGKVVM
jgi:hypothetical protein